MATLDECIAAGPDADAALLRLERLRETGVALPSDGTGATLLSAVLSSGDFLSDILLGNPTRLPALLDNPWLARSKPRDVFAHELRAACAAVRTFSDLQRELRRYAQGEMLRLGAREIGAGIGANAFTLPEHGLTLEVARELSALADVCLQETVTFCEVELRKNFGAPVCNDSAPGFSVLAMGKLGGEELNFSSDIDIVYLYATDDGRAGTLSLHEYYARLCKLVTRAISEPTADGFVFRVDLRLRPEGQSGAICNSLAATESYYESFGRTWERQALLRTRHSAGDAWLGEAFIKMVEPFVYKRISDEKTLEDVRSLRRLFVDRTAGTAWNVKLSTGGIRDVELVAQVLQLLYGGRRRDLRERTTLPALRKLGLAGLLSGQEVRTLSEAYRLLRRIEHRLQLERGQQTHVLPSDDADVAKLAKRLGFAGLDEFRDAVETMRSAVCAIADTLGEPASGPPPLVLRLLAPTSGKDQIERDLRAAGFRDLERSTSSLETARAPAARLAGRSHRLARPGSRTRPSARPRAPILARAFRVAWRKSPTSAHARRALRHQRAPVAAPHHPSRDLARAHGRARRSPARSADLAREFRVPARRLRLRNRAPPHAQLPGRGDPAHWPPRCGREPDPRTGVRPTFANGRGYP